MADGPGREFIYRGGTKTEPTSSSGGTTTTTSSAKPYVRSSALLGGGASRGFRRKPLLGFLEDEFGPKRIVPGQAVPDAPDIRAARRRQEKAGIAVRGIPLFGFAGFMK
jgi:hypothetical protein